MKILILANSRYKGGLSGGDAIYESFKKYWPCEFIEDNCNIEYSPFAVCYVQRIVMSILRALFDFRSFDIVYSSSDFLPDSIPGFIYKLKGNKWVAGYFLKAFKENPIHYYSQKVVRQLIEWFADMVIVTNPTMFDVFSEGKKKTWINGGIDLSLAGLSDKPKIYDAVFCGRIHPSKGIDELIDIWRLVRNKKRDAELAIIGDGDLGLQYIKNRIRLNFKIGEPHGINILGYMGNERFDIYKQSRVVLYTTPLGYDHFSMAPVEAMACGCPMISFSLDTIDRLDVQGNLWCSNNQCIAKEIIDFSRFGVGHIGISAHRWSQQFDYKKQSLRVWEEVNANINHRS